MPKQPQDSADHVHSKAQRRAEETALCSAEDQKLSAERIANEQRTTAATAAHARALTEIKQHHAEQDARIASASNARAIETIKADYVRVLADGFSPFACQRMAHSYCKANTEHERVKGKPLDRPLTLALADHHVAVNPSAVEALACSGVLFETNSFGSSIADRADAARRALLNPNNPIAIRDALALLDGAIAEAGARSGPRMALDAAKKRFAILMCSKSTDQEAAAIGAHDLEISRPKREEQAKLEELMQRAAAGDEGAISALGAIPYALERAAKMVRGDGRSLPARLRAAVGW
jgi:hypothetical protein